MSPHSTLLAACFTLMGSPAAAQINTGERPSGLRLTF